MYAVFKTGGKQYRASQGEKLKIEKLAAQPGDTVEFTDVLAVGEGESLKVGQPMLSGARVTGKVVTQGRAEKVSVIKFRRRKHYQRVGNHRQSFTLVEITGIAGA
jgi:large subunit ribosomal protein L21